MVEIIEPHGGTVFDPACGSGGMFVQSAQFIEEHRKDLEAQGTDTSVFVSGQEKESEKVPDYGHLLPEEIRECTF